MRLCCEVHAAATQGIGLASRALTGAACLCDCHWRLPLVAVAGCLGFFRLTVCQRRWISARNRTESINLQPVIMVDEVAVRSHMVSSADRQLSCGGDGQSTHAGSPQYIFGHLAGGDGGAPSPHLPRRLPALCRRVHECSAHWWPGGRQRSQDWRQQQQEHAVRNSDGSTMVCGSLCGACRWVVPCRAPAAAVVPEAPSFLHIAARTKWSCSARERQLKQKLRPH